MQPVPLPTWAKHITPGLNPDFNANILRFSAESPAHPEHSYDYRYPSPLRLAPAPTSFEQVPSLSMKHYVLEEEQAVPPVHQPRLKQVLPGTRQCPHNLVAEAWRWHCRFDSGEVALKAEAPLQGEHGFSRLVVDRIAATSADGTQARQTTDGLLWDRYLVSARVLLSASHQWCCQRLQSLRLALTHSAHACSNLHRAWLSYGCATGQSSFKPRSSHCYAGAGDSVPFKTRAAQWQRALAADGIRRLWRVSRRGLPPGAATTAAARLDAGLCARAWRWRAGQEVRLSLRVCQREDMHDESCCRSKASYWVMLGPESCLAGVHVTY